MLEEEKAFLEDPFKDIVQSRRIVCRALDIPYNTARFDDQPAIPTGIE